MTKTEIINKVKELQLPVIICGAGIVGEEIFKLCRKAGIKVECFCDNSLKAVKSKFCGLEVIHTPALKARFKEAVIIISAAAIKDVVDLLRDLGFQHWLAGGLMLKDFDTTQNSPDASLDYARFAIENCILCHDGYLRPDKLFLRSIDLIITERCSLRCRDCSNLMQYYEKPKDCEREMLLRSIDLFCSVIDEVMDFRVIGGETFIARDWQIIVQRLIKEPKAKRVVLYTNGTIIPDQARLEILRDDKILVIITDYGKLSRKLNELKRIMENNKIAHHVLKITDWLDCSAIKRQHRQPEQIKELYKLCCAKNMATLSDGKLFRCPYAANAARLGAVPDINGDYIDLFKEPLDPPKLPTTKQKVKDYLLSKEYLGTCDFCNGRPLSGNEVPPAIQSRRPLPYKKHITSQDSGNN